MLVVIGIIILIASLGAFIGFDTIGRSNVHSERDLFVSLLTGARARALANVNQSTHGVHIDPTNFVLFEDSTAPYTYTSGDPNNRVVARNASVTKTGPGPDDILFLQLSGNVPVLNTGTVTLTGGAQSATIEINTAGRIDW